jgi:hypothetical protein
MNKKILLLVLAFLLVLAPVKAAIGCCYNPKYPVPCFGQIDTTDCCPDQGLFPNYYWTQADQRGPVDNSECISDFFDTGEDCGAVAECTDVGCCCPDATIISSVDCFGQWYPVYDDCIALCAPKQCGDAVDNDGDGCCDFNGCEGKPADPGCDSIDDDNESDRTCTIGGQCLQSRTPILSELQRRVSNDRGERRITLEWVDDSVCQAESFEIQRCEGASCTDFEEVGSTVYSIYIDPDVNWDTYYRYMIIGHYAVAQNSDPLESDNLFMGHLECWYKYDEDPFCINRAFYSDFSDYMGEQGIVEADKLVERGEEAYSCDEENVLTLIRDCKQEGMGFICVIDKDDVAQCVKDPFGCVAFPSAKPFGMFYTPGLCEGTTESDGPYYCFYDRSDLFVDRCYRCQPEMNCYDYKSEYACTTDNCGAGDCEWHPHTEYGTFGIGVCVDLDIDNCEFCDKRGTLNDAGNPVMQNSYAFNEVYDMCTKEKAQLLSTAKHMCYFSDGVARSCRYAICTDYTYDHCDPGSSDYDPCQMDSCEWFGSFFTGECYKNAYAAPYDDPDNTDCGLKDDPASPWDEDCEIDRYPPNTTIVPTINSRGVFENLQLIIQDQKDPDSLPMIIGEEEREGYSTYLCVGNDCDVMMYSTNGSILAVVPVDADQDGEFDYAAIVEAEGSQIWQLVDGDNNLKFLSRDDSLNLEEEKSMNVLAYKDLIGPIVRGVTITGGTQASDGTLYTNVLRPTISMSFYTNTSVEFLDMYKIRDVGAPLQIATEPNFYVPVRGKVIQVGLSSTTGNLGPGKHIIKLYAARTMNILNDILMDEDQNITFVIDVTAPAIISQTIEEGDIITDHDFNLGFTFNEDVKLLNMTMNGVDTLSNYSSVYQDLHQANFNLSDASYYVNLRFKDYAGNIGAANFTFAVDAEPTVIELVEPSFGVSPEYLFDIVVETDNYVKCRYNFNLWTPYLQSTPFDMSGFATAHTKAGFGAIPPGITQPYDFYVKCDDESTWGVVERTFKLRVDPSPPNITRAYAFPWLVAEYVDPATEDAFGTTLKVETDDKTICRYSDEMVSYDDMPGNFDGYEDYMFKNINSAFITVLSEGNYSRWVACENEAGLKSTTRRIDFTVDLTAPMIVDSLTPYYNSGTVRLSVSSNKRGFCYYSNSDQTVSTNAFPFGPPDHMHEKILSLPAGEYTYYVKCSDPVFLGEYSEPIQIDFIVDTSPPMMAYANDTNVLIPVNPEAICYKWITARWFAVDDMTAIGKYAYSIYEEGSDDKILNWTEDYTIGGKIVAIRNQDNHLNLTNGTRYYLKARAANIVGLWSDPMETNGFLVDDALCEIECENIKDDCCYAYGDDACDPDCMQGFDPDCGLCTNNASDCCNTDPDGICDVDCPPYGDIDCIPVCQTGFCDAAENRWCDDGFWSNESYCDPDNCAGVDIDCGLLCSIPGLCETSAQIWCDDDIWSGEDYCVHCYIYDGSCPICETDNCDTENQKWCEEGYWSVIDYCGSCGGYDAYCNETCENDACDLTSEMWCDAGTWSSEDYCVACGDKDSRCTYDCMPYACDTDAKKWCDDGRWNTTDYCTYCGSYDVVCGQSCASGTCDTSSNVWCDIDTWAQGGYCDHCDDPVCGGTCTGGTCDIKNNEWCSLGDWTTEDYCSHCGEFDSDCSIVCEDRACDIVNDVWCDEGEWTPDNYCDYCAFDDSDCIDICPHGYCDVSNELWCSQGNWTNETYCEYCYAFDSNCPSGCSSSQGDCCNKADDNVCDPDCFEGEDPNCGPCTPAMGDCCVPDPDGTCDYDCPSGIDPDCGDACIIAGDCSDGHPCQDDFVCDSNWCDNGICAPSSCDDGMENGDESDVDCGGDCGGCEDGENCGSGHDCISGYCNNGVCGEPGECENSILGGAESDVDCGGNCPGCGVGENCYVDDDCVSGAICHESVCTVAADLAEIDSDGDGIPDEWELNNGLDPNDPTDAERDLDGDGLSNLDEYLQNTNPNKPDTDDDGYKDGREVEAGTDPLDPSDYPKSNIWWILLLILIILVILGLVGYLVYILWGDKIKKQVAVWMKKPIKGVRPLRQPYRPYRKAPYRPMVRPPARPGVQIRPVTQIKPSIKPVIKPIVKDSGALSKLRGIAGMPQQVTVVQKGKPISTFDRLKSIASGKPVEKSVRGGSPLDKLKYIATGKTPKIEIKVEVPKGKEGPKRKEESIFDKLKAVAEGEEKAKKKIIEKPVPGKTVERIIEKPKPSGSPFDKLKSLAGKPQVKEKEKVVEKFKAEKPKPAKQPKPAAPKPSKPKPAKKYKKKTKKKPRKMTKTLEKQVKSAARKAAREIARKTTKKTLKSTVKKTAKKEVKKAADKDVFKKLAKLSKKKK